MRGTIELTASLPTLRSYNPTPCGFSVRVLMKNDFFPQKRRDLAHLQTLVEAEVAKIGKDQNLCVAFVNFVA
jgi:hypothetical protein